MNLCYNGEVALGDRSANFGRVRQESNRFFHFFFSNVTSPFRPHQSGVLRIWYWILCLVLYWMRFSSNSLSLVILFSGSNYLSSSNIGCMRLAVWLATHTHSMFPSSVYKMAQRRLQTRKERLKVKNHSRLVPGESGWWPACGICLNSATWQVEGCGRPGSYPETPIECVELLFFLCPFLCGLLRRSLPFLFPLFVAGGLTFVSFVNHSIILGAPPFTPS